MCRSRAKIIDGKSIAEDVRQEVKIEVERIVSTGKRAPHLTAIQVGSDPASSTYIKNKMKATRSVGERLDYMYLSNQRILYHRNRTDNAHLFCRHNQ